MNELKYIGFWKIKKEAYENIMPFEKDWQYIPIENSAKENQNYLINLLEKKQELINLNNVNNIMQYYGCCKCRICNINNGSEEYCIDGFIWPSGYLYYIK